MRVMESSERIAKCTHIGLMLHELCVVERVDALCFLRFVILVHQDGDMNNTLGD